ncbi:MAG: chorismate-binding protein [Desulfotalea sp.]
MTVPIKQLLQSCLDSDLSFVSYRQPGGEITTIIQKDVEAREIIKTTDISLQRGFVFSPYVESENCKKIIISPDLVIVGNKCTTDIYDEINFSQKIKTKNSDCLQPTYTCGEEEYKDQIGKIVDAINKGDVEKAVLSRLQLVPEDQREKLVDNYLAMCEKYSFSFVYLLRAGGQLWLGATPETLASMTDSQFSTISLAATRSNLLENRNLSSWTDKEKQEQQYVTDYISSCLKERASGSLQIGKRYVRQAGALLHLCTDFVCSAKEIKGHLSELLGHLHPTPAVCGMPRENARKLLCSIEKHNRQYYSGYLGPVNIFPEQISLYVNLRCMFVCSNSARIFMGGGITADSVPADEWQETVMKSKTILSVLG